MAGACPGRPHPDGLTANPSTVELTLPVAGDETAAMHQPRSTAARVVAGVAAVFWGWLFFGVQDTLTVFVEGQRFATHYLMETGWGLLFLVLVAVPLIGLTVRPRTLVLVAQVATVGVAVVVGALLAGSPAHLFPAAGLLLTAAAVAALGRVDLRSPRPRIDPPLAVLALIAAVPALVYAWHISKPPGDVEQTVGLDHYPIQSALGVVLALLALLVALTRTWSTAWLSAVSVTVTTGWIGIESVIYPHLHGSFGTVWGWLALGWAVTFLVAALRLTPRRSWTPPSGSGTPRRSRTPPQTPAAHRSRAARRALPRR